MKIWLVKRKRILKFFLKKERAAVFLKTLLVASLVFSSVFSIGAEAATGTPSIMSYQGRLADSNGDLLGGTGTTYYFKFSIWNLSTGGVAATNRLWPTSAPTSVGLTVRQGVFVANIGDTANGFPDTLDYNFNTSSDVYLQVEVSSDNSTFQTLSPRQRISATPFAKLSAAVSGSSTPSSFGTTNPFGTSVVSIEATSTSATALSLRAALSQIANLFQIQDSTGANLLSVNATGGLFASSTLGVTGTTNLYSALNVSGLTTLNGSIDAGSSTSFILPNSAAPTVDVFGKIAGDNNLWGASRGAPIFFDGTASTALVNVLTSDTPLNGQVPKWNTGGTITWEDDVTSAGAGVSTIQEGDATIDGAANTIDFLAADFDVTSSPAGEANVAIDYTNSGITRKGQNENITGLWNFINSSSTRFSVFNTAYFGGTATSTFNSAGTLTLAGLASSGLGVNASGQVYAAATTTYSGGLTYANGNVTADLGTAIDNTEITNGTIVAADLNLTDITLADFTNDASFITTSGANVFTGLQRFTNASTSLLSVTGTSYFGGTATSTFNSAGTLTLAGLTSSGLGVNASGQVYAAATTTYSGGLTYANGNVTADLGTSITAAEIANGDHGDFTYSSGTA
ncbi:MAG: hypothetical protein Q7K40_02980, partial [bacterium]|nr:hypothetical protein [bacterium]